MRRILLTSLFIGFTIVGYSQIPDWTNYSTRVSKYSDNIFFTGFISQYVKKKDDFNAIQDDLLSRSKSTLSEGIKVNIESSITNEMTNVNSVSKEEFKKISRSFSSIEISGVQSEFSLSKNRKEAYAFAWVRKSKVKKYYQNLVATNISQAEAKISQADKLIESNEGVKAIPLLQDALVLVRKLEEAQTILIICGENNEAVLNHNKGLELGASIASKMDQIRSNHDFNLNELAYYLSNQLYLKDKGVDKIQIENIFYQDTNMSSKLSARLNSLLKSNISKENVSIVESSNGDIQDGFSLEGSYWESDDELQIMLNLYNRKGSERLLVNSVEGWIKVEQLEKIKLDFKPINFLQAKAKNNVFAQNAVVNGGSSLNIWTNKGSNGPVFKEGDRLKIFINSSQPGYLRLLNFWADGTQLLLQDNFYISPERTNQTIEIPADWETACPCGIEYLHGIVQSEPFQKLNTVEELGFLFIQDGFEEVVKNSRGFKKKLSVEGNFMAERKIMLTTLE